MRGALAFILLHFSTFALPISSANNITVAVQPERVVVRERDSFQLSCTASVEGHAANISLYYSWEKDGDLLLNGSNQISVSRASIRDGGVYVCVVEAGGIEGTSENATVTVVASGEDDAPFIALVVCVTAIGVLSITLLTFTGLYRCFCTPREHHGRSKLCSCESQDGGKRRQSQRVPARLSPSVPRHFAKTDRSKSKSLSHLLQENFPLDCNLHRSSTNQLAGSQPTQVTEVEDPNALDDLGLDESMFEQDTLGGGLNDRHKNQPDTSTNNKNKRMNKVGRQSESRRRASEGTLVVPSTMRRSTSLKSILKESRSVNDNLHDTSRSCAVSDVSSEVTHSDDNSLNLRKSVRFNVEEWAEDSGVHTGTSTPHNAPYSSLKRRSSEPETFGYHYSNGERRGSAPGDLVSQTDTKSAEDENENINRERDTNEVDEGLAAGSEEWSRKENNFDFEKEQVETRFEGIFSSEADTETSQTTHKMGAQAESNTEDAVNIASRVAKLYSAAHKQPNMGGFTRGPSSLTTSYHSATISVAEVKRRLLEKRQQEAAVAGSTGREDGRRPSLSKLVQERAEVFRVTPDRKIDLRTASLDRAHIRRGKPLDTSMITPIAGGEKPGKRKITTERVASVKEKSSKEGKKEEHSKPGKHKQEKDRKREDVMAASAPPVAIPVFSGHSNLSNWVPACLRETVISPYHSYENTDHSGSEEGESSSSDDEDTMMEPLEPTFGAAPIAVGPLLTFGGVATMTPIGRSWLTSPSNTFGGSRATQSTKPIMSGAREMSPFNELVSLPLGGHRLGGTNRLSVIPEETASACNSMTSMHTE